MNGTLKTPEVNIELSQACARMPVFTCRHISHTYNTDTHTHTIQTRTTLTRRRYFYSFTLNKPEVTDWKELQAGQGSEHEG